MLGVREALAAEPEGQGDASVRDVVGVAEVVGNYYMGCSLSLYLPLIEA
jgi:hypothetical protein